MSTFQDEVSFAIKAGHGGPGSVHFHKEKFVPFGGPDGGDGGSGGDVIFVSDHRVLTLENFIPHHTYQAEDGQPGSGREKAGRKGKNLVLKVPVGTQILGKETLEQLFDFAKEGEEFRLAKGGRGGKGNSFFKSSTNQAPTFAQPGEEGEFFSLHLQLKLIADLGIVGFPNAGKSTLLSKLTEAHPKIAGYAFTTLTPNLGIAKDEDETFRYTIADIPGIVEGASQGIGLGISFLKHIERVRGILFLFDASLLQMREEYKMLRHELSQYNAMLLNKPHLLVFNKSDLWEDENFAMELVESHRDLGEIICISCNSGNGLEQLKNRIKSIFFLEVINEI